ncbi:MAG: hypothetical protein HY922_11255 [Elusimicrobia bacterium]|nr:hypothetical protein [Elusimicrobiota bacterium]
MTDPRPSAVSLLTLIESWRKEVLRAEKTFAALQESLSKAGDAVGGADAAAKMEEFSRQFERARKFEAAFARQNKEIEALRKALESKESALGSWRQTCEKTSSRASLLEKQAADAEKAVKQAEAALERQRNKVEELNKVLAARESELDSWQQKYENELSRTSELKRQAAQAAKAALRAEAEADRQKSRIEELTKALAAKESAHGSWRQKQDEDLSRALELEKQNAAAEKAAALWEAPSSQALDVSLSPERAAKQAEAKPQKPAVAEKKAPKAEAPPPSPASGDQPAPARTAVPKPPPQAAGEPAATAAAPSGSGKTAPSGDVSNFPNDVGSIRPNLRRPEDLDGASQSAPGQHRAAHEAYGRMISLMKALQSKASDGLWLLDPLSRSLAECLELLDASPYPLLILTGRSTAENYLHAHSVNVAVLSMRLGRSLGRQKGTVHRLGLAAALHESQLMSLTGLTHAPGAQEAQTVREREQRLHPMDQQGIRNHLALIEVALERPFPEPADRKLAAHLIGICDIYEALSHPRPWRKPLLCHKAVLTIIKELAKEFDHRAVQAFVQSFSLYPPGSHVELSNGRIARVIAVKAQTPSLPTVEVRLDPNGKPPSQALILDLAKSPLARIVRAVDAAKLPIEDKTVRSAFEAERWWTQPS